MTFYEELVEKHGEPNMENYGEHGPEEGLIRGPMIEIDPMGIGRLGRRYYVNNSIVQPLIKWGVVGILFVAFLMVVFVQIELWRIG